MKFFYCLCAVALLGMFACSANAFRLQVLDPPGTFDGIPDWQINPPLSTIYLVPFSTSNCISPYPAVPAGTSCSVVVNDTGSPITSLEMVFQAPLLTGPADCGSDFYTAANGGTLDADFTGATCNDNAGTYTLDFYGGTGIPSLGVFEFVTDADPSDFPENLTATPNVPEPASIWMLSSAAAMLGLLMFARRRSLHDSLL